MAVAEACRNVVCAGGRPLAITDCLNFGDPTKPDVYYQLEECIKGMSAACEALNVPVVSGNVSLFNESQAQAVYPTPVVGAVGLLPTADARLTMAFQREGDAILLIGQHDGNARSLAGSEYLSLVHMQVSGQPSIDLAAEARLQSLLLELVDEGMLRSAHDCADGGLGVAIAESAIAGGIGGSCTIPSESRWDASLFGEAPSRIVVTCEADQVEAILRRAKAASVPASRMGSVGGARLVIDRLIDEPLDALTEAYENGLEAALAG